MPDEAKIEPQLMTAEELWATFPHCCGYPNCDGYLEGMPHENVCPMYPDKSEPTMTDFAEAYAACRPRESADGRASWEAGRDAAADLVRAGRYPGTTESAIRALQYPGPSNPSSSHGLLLEALKKLKDVVLTEDMSAKLAAIVEAEAAIALAEKEGK
jgi:hypothetical protein